MLLSGRHRKLCAVRISRLGLCTPGACPIARPGAVFCLFIIVFMYWSCHIGRRCSIFCGSLWVHYGFSFGWMGGGASTIDPCAGPCKCACLHGVPTFWVIATTDGLIISKIAGFPNLGVHRPSLYTRRVSCRQTKLRYFPSIRWQIVSSS